MNVAETTGFSGHGPSFRDLAGVDIEGKMDELFREYSSWNPNAREGSSFHRKEIRNRGEHGLSDADWTKSPT